MVDVEYQEADKWMQVKLDKWFEDAKASLEDNEITNLAYEARDLYDVAEALRELSNELGLLYHDSAALATNRAALAVRFAADKIGAINGE